MQAIIPRSPPTTKKEQKKNTTYFAYNAHFCFWWEARIQIRATERLLYECTEMETTKMQLFV